MSLSAPRNDRGSVASSPAVIASEVKQSQVIVNLPGIAEDRRKLWNPRKTRSRLIIW